MGYTPEQVGRMTLDQVLFCLCDRDVLKGVKTIHPLEAASTGKIFGESKAERLAKRTRCKERK